jgi:outer membrane biosynthesis protein TonB
LSWAAQSDGRYIFNGIFDDVDGTSYPSSGTNIVRINNDGTLDTTLPNLTGIVGLGDFMYSEPDGHIVGSNGTSEVNYLINPDGSVQSGFALAAPSSFVIAGMDSSGRIYAFNNSRILARYNPDGTTDAGFSNLTALSSGQLPKVLPLDDAKSFVVIPQTVGLGVNIKRLGSDGSIDTSFSTVASRNDGTVGVAGYCTFSDDSLLTVIENNFPNGQTYFACIHYSAAGAQDYSYSFVHGGADAPIFAGAAYDLLLRIGGTVATLSVNGATIRVSSAGVATVVDSAAGFYTFYALPTRLSRVTPGTSPSVPTTPVFFTQPTGYTGLANSVTMTALAVGLQAFTYQWFQDGIPVAGATSNSYTINGSLIDAGVYYLQATYNGVSASSQTATITFTDPPVISIPPAGASVSVGDSLTLNVTAHGGGTLSYQWEKNTAPITNATSSFLSLQNIQLGDAGSYQVVVSNAYGTATSTAAMLAVASGPTPIPTPTPTPTPTATPTPTYTPTPTQDTTPTPIPSPTPTRNVTPTPSSTPTPSATPTPTPTSATPPTPSPTGTTTVTPTPAPTSPPVVVLSQAGTPPSAQVLPVSQSVPAGQGATFTVSSTDALSGYQWYFDGAAIPSATGPSYSIASAGVGDAGSYTVSATGASGNVVSSGALLAIDSAGSPQVPAQPQPQTVTAGSTVIFSIENGSIVSTADHISPKVQTAASGTSYQWFENGVSLQGATGPSLLISVPAGGNSAYFNCLLTNASGSTLTSAAKLNVVTTTNPGHLINISTRGMVQTGGGIMIAGVVLKGGSGANDPVLIRASGPALTSFGVTGTLADPRIVLLSDQDVIATDTGWGGSAGIFSEASSVGAFTWGATATPDSAISTSLEQGSYTAQVSSAGGSTGVSLVEVYDATNGAFQGASAPHLVNISTRAYVGTGGNILIAGFVIGGTTSQTVLIRASGPALNAFNVPGTIPDPRLTLVSDQKTIATNAGWNGDALVAAEAAAAGAFSWGTAATLDSAILITLPPGSYTAQVQGASGDTGIALVEVYAIP